MKKVKKGFTLVELLIVIGVIGILATMTMIGGTEATNIAKATRIADEFDKLSSIMMEYYADNYAVADAGTLKVADLLTGVKARLKTADEALVVSDKEAVGKYLITVLEEAPYEWWLTYTLEAANTKVGEILMSKNARFGFKTATDGKTDYAGAAAVCMKVR